MTLAKQLEVFIDGLGLRHFKGSELSPYWTRNRGGAKNTVPPKSLWGNIVEPLVVLDEVREQIGHPILITSTYRSPAYNSAVGGARFSIHMQFGAIDFQSRQGGSKGVKIPTPRELWATAESLRGKTFRNPVTGKSFKFKGGLGLYKTFVHLDCRGVNANW
jgi:hypothetical protein